MDVVPTFKMDGATFRLTREEMGDLAVFLDITLDNLDPDRQPHPGEQVASGLCVLLNSLINADFARSCQRHQAEEASHRTAEWKTIADDAFAKLVAHTGGATYQRVTEEDYPRGTNDQ